MRITEAETEDEIRGCYPILRQLRPHLDEAQFLAQVRRQVRNHGYRLVRLEADEAVKAAAGYRVAEYLAWGKILYVDDLITGEGERGRGFAGLLLDWLEGRAKAMECAEIHLDSGVQRFDAHRLYLKKRMNISCHHFSRPLA